MNKALKTLLTASTALLLSTAAVHAKGGLKNADNDGNGRIDITEFRAQADKRFDAIDADKDGNITKEEKEAAKAAKKAERKAKREARRAEKKAAGKEQARKKGKKGERKNRKNIDTNDDGVVSKTEYDVATEKRFAKMDANGDGEITKDEVKSKRGKKKAAE